MKGMVSKITGSLFQIYSRPDSESSKDNKLFIKLFLTKYAKPLMHTHMQIVLKVDREFISCKTLGFSLEYLTRSAAIPETKAEIPKQFIEDYLREKLFHIVMIK